ncbi:MAG TPA: hypothetical protein VJU34_11555 [Phenylobacterium sp.]|nr:hypothetical protein [Phenylobacterium sp.]
MVTSIDPSLLLGIYNSRLGASGGMDLSSPSTAKQRVAPTAPWTQPTTPEAASAAVKAALSGRKLINENAAQLDLPNASTDYRKLFALYQGLSTLSGLVDQVQKKGLTSIETQRIQKTFAAGLEEVAAYARTAALDKVRLTSGEVGSTTKTTVPVAAAKTEYVTAPLYAGSSADAVPRFQGDVKFSITVNRSGATYNVPIDLNDMGAQTRSMANVVNFINGELQNAGVDTRFATQRLPGAERTITAGGPTIKLGPGPDQWAFKVKPGGEAVTFSAAVSAPAVYMTQAIGDPNPDGKIDTNDGVISQQLLKFQTEVPAGMTAPVAGQNDPNWVDGRAFAKTLGPEVKTVRATKVGPDGSVYMLADVNNKVAGQEIKGAQDVALLKYDPAGNLIYTRTLGASDTASGLGLQVAADGRVAIAGSVVGGLNGAQEGPLNSGTAFAKEADSFVTVFNAEGEEMWTQRRGARLADEASQIVFGDNNMIYVAGRSKSALPGATGLGDWDSYIEGFGPPSTAVLTKGQVPTTFTQSFGTSGADRPAGMVLDGTNLVTASVENGRAVLRRFDISSGSPVLASTRDLGDLQGGDIAGLALDGGDVVIAGSTSNGALAVGSTTKALSGGVDAFAARIPKDLSPGGTLAYYGGTGDDRATALSVSNGKVYIAGSAGTDLPGQAPVGKKDGFLANINIATGTADWSRRFTGKEGYATPGSLAVDDTGASALDRLGLPKGALDLTDSQKITAASSIRAGEQFTVRSGTGRPQTITIEADDTLTTLGTKIKRATGFQAKVSVTSSGGIRKLTVTPLNARTIIEFSAGKVNKDALEFLGIPEGVVRNTIVNDKGVSEPADGKGQIFGLGLEADLNLTSAVEIAHSAADISTAMGVVRKAYKDLVAQATPQSAQAAAAAASGPVPLYLQNQLANYQAALARLGG